MFENGKSRFVWMPLIPSGFYAFVTMSYILNAKIGFNRPWNVVYILAAVLIAIYLVAIIMSGKKRANEQIKAI